MKKTLIALLISTSIFFLVGCGSNNNESSNNVTSSGQSQSNDKDSTSEKDSNKDKDKNNTEKENESTDNNTEVKNEETTVTLFTPNGNADGLDKSDVTISHLTAYSIVNALVNSNAVPSGTKALNFEVKNNIGYLDVSSNIYNLFYGSTVESLMLDSIRETFLNAFNIEKIKLTVEGNTYKGQHIEFNSSEYL